MCKSLGCQDNLLQVIYLQVPSGGRCFIKFKFVFKILHPGVYKMFYIIRDLSLL